MNQTRTQLRGVHWNATPATYPLTTARTVACHLPDRQAQRGHGATGLWQNRYGDWADLVAIMADSYDSEGADGARDHLHRHLNEIAEALAAPHKGASPMTRHVGTDKYVTNPYISALREAITAKRITAEHDAQAARQLDEACRRARREGLIPIAHIARELHEERYRVYEAIARAEQNPENNVRK